MQNDIFLLFRVLAFAVFFAALYVGYYMLKNYQKLFGVDQNLPSEGSSSRAYSQVQIFSVWAHVVLGSGAAALLLH
jgi:hypothetical protein